MIGHGYYHTTGAGPYLMENANCRAVRPAYRPVSRRSGQALSALLRPDHGLVPFLGRPAAGYGGPGAQPVAQSGGSMRSLARVIGYARRGIPQLA